MDALEPQDPFWFDAIERGAVVAIEEGNFDCNQSVDHAWKRLKCGLHWECWTPLLYAVHHDNAEIVRSLLRMKANPNVGALQDGSYQYPLDYARKHDRKNSLDVLEDTK